MTLCKSLLPLFVGNVFGWSGALHFINHNFDQAFPRELFAILAFVVVLNAAVYGLVHVYQRDSGKTGIVTAISIFSVLNFDGFYLQFCKHFWFTDRLQFAAGCIAFIVVLN